VVGRGFRFGENAQKRAHFVIFENRSFCREKRLETGRLVEGVFLALLTFGAFGEKMRFSRVSM